MDAAHRRPASGLCDPHGSWSGLPLDARQTEEVLLTAAQSAFAVALLVSLSLSRWEAIFLFGLFIVQFLIPNEQIRMVIAVVCMVLAAGILIRERHNIGTLLHHARAALSPQREVAEPTPAEP